MPDGLRHALHTVAQHTGIPVVLLAALALVVSWRLLKFAKSALRLALQVAVVAVLLVVATHLGWLRW